MLFNQQGALQATLPRKQGALLSRLNPSTTAGRSLVGACWCAGGVRLYEGGNLAVASLACEYERSCTALVRHATVRASLEQLRYEMHVASRCGTVEKRARVKEAPTLWRIEESGLRGESGLHGLEPAIAAGHVWVHLGRCRLRPKSMRRFRGQGSDGPAQLSGTYVRDTQEFYKKLRANWARDWRALALTQVHRKKRVPGSQAGGAPHLELSRRDLTTRHAKNTPYTYYFLLAGVA